MLQEDGDGIFMKEVGGMLLEQSKAIIQFVYGDLYLRCHSTPSLKQDQDRLKQVYRKNVSLKSCDKNGICDTLLSRLPFLMEYANAAFEEWARSCLGKEGRSLYVNEMPHTSFLDLFLKKCSDHPSIKEMDYFTNTTQEKNCVCREILRNCFDELRREFTVLQEGFESHAQYDLSKSMSPDDSISNVDGQTRVSHRRPSDMIEEARRESESRSKLSKQDEDCETNGEKMIELNNPKQQKDDSSSISKKTSSKQSSTSSTLSKQSLSSKSVHTNHTQKSPSSNHTSKDSLKDET